MTRDFQQCGMCDQQRLRPACAYAQSDQSLCQSLEYSMNIKLLTEHHLEFLSLKGGCTGSSESTLVKMPHCWKSHVMAHLSLTFCHTRVLICFSKYFPIHSVIRTSDSLSEGLPIKMTREKSQRKRYFFYETDSKFNPRLIHKSSFLNGQVQIEKYGLKTLFLLFNI